MKKRIILLISALFFICFNAFSFEYKIEKNETNEWIFETSFSELVQSKINGEIRIQNNSKLILTRVGCSVIIKGNEHKLQSISKIKVGEREEFEGYEDDEMKDEFPFYFGKDGKFLKSNKNQIILKIKFPDNQDDVIITAALANDKSLLFIVEDSSDL